VYVKSIQTGTYALGKYQKEGEMYNGKILKCINNNI